MWKLNINKGPWKKSDHNLLEFVIVKEKKIGHRTIHTREFTKASLKIKVQRKKW